MGLMETPLFTVIMPTYQRARMLPSAMRTLLDQTLQDFECLIIDDGSTDGTEEVVQGLNLPEGKFKYVRFDHMGNMWCRNRAIEMAKGEWITYLDTDDFWLPRRLAEFKKRMDAKPEVGFWFSNGYHHRYGRILPTVFDPTADVPEGKIPGHFAVGTEFLPYITTNVAIRRKLFDKDAYGLYRSDMVILDNERYARMFAGGVEVGVLKEPLAVRRIHDQQVTHLWIEEFPEAVEALKAGNPSPEVLEAETRKLVEEVADYLLKSLDPQKTREFLIEHLGDRARTSPTWKWTRVPRPVLAWMKAARRQWLRFQHHPAFAPEDYRRAYEYVQPLIDSEPAAR